MNKKRKKNGTEIWGLNNIRNAFYEDIYLYTEKRNDAKPSNNVDGQK